ncbi:MAG: heavy metal sensor histidine kinase [Nitrospirae bacterium]|nr:heavy metal sensor histidine kinase [Nitrospirota bacterium]
MPIWTKLTIWYGILVIVVLILMGGIRFVWYRQTLLNQMDYSLKVVSDVLDSSLPGKTLSKEAMQKTISGVIDEYPDIEWKGIFIQVFGHSRSILFSSISEGEPLPITEAMWKKALHRKTEIATVLMDDQRTQMRMLSKPVFRQKEFLYLILIGSSMEDIESTLEKIFRLNLLFIPATTLFVAIGGWLLMRQALKPLDAVIKTASKISSGDLSHRIKASKANREINELAIAFNTMITRLEGSFQQVRDFSDNVSHELRIPLSILRGQTELSLRRTRSNDEYIGTLKSNLEEIERMEMIVERLLFLSRAERGEVPLNSIQINLNALLEDIYFKFLVPAQEKGINIMFDKKSQVFVIGDEVLLCEVLLNLVQNALTYTEPGGEIRLSSEEDADNVRISVSDTGCGIPDEDIPRIFDRFYQVNKSRSGKGSGLGLSICQWITQAHQGKIKVRSRVGHGSQFILCLPILKD